MHARACRVHIGTSGPSQKQAGSTTPQGVHPRQPDLSTSHLYEPTPSMHCQAGRAHVGTHPFPPEPPSPPVPAAPLLPPLAGEPPDPLAVPPPPAVPPVPAVPRPAKPPTDPFALPPAPSKGAPSPFGEAVTFRVPHPALTTSTTRPTSDATDMIDAPAPDENLPRSLILMLDGSPAKTPLPRTLQGWHGRGRAHPALVSTIWWMSRLTRDHVEVGLGCPRGSALTEDAARGL